MSIILHLETATEVCSVALSSGSNLLCLEENLDGNVHASQLNLLIEACLVTAKIEMKRLSAICVSKGPGSYTGLRVGVSAAKGLCYALDIPLIGVNTLTALATGMKQKTDFPGNENVVFIPMIDARRMEVYCAVFDHNLNILEAPSAKIIDEHSFNEFLDSKRVYFFGNGAIKCLGTIDHPNAVFFDNERCSAEYLIHPAHSKFNKKEFEDVAYFEPYYLKDFVGTTPKKR